MYYSRALVLITTLITLQSPPITASPISKRFIPLTTPTLSTSSLHPLADTPPPQSSPTKFTILSDPRPEYPPGSCQSICGLSKRALSEDMPTVTITERLYTHPPDATLSIIIENIPEQPPPTQKIQDIQTQTQTTQDISPSSSTNECDCAGLKLSEDIADWLRKEIAKNSMTTNATTTSITTKTILSTSTSPSASNHPRSVVPAIVIGSCALFLLCILFVWAAVIIYRIIKAKREEKQKQRTEKRFSQISIDSLNFDRDQMMNHISSFLGQPAVSESREVLVSGAGEVVVEVGAVEAVEVEDGVRASQVGVAK